MRFDEALSNKLSLRGRLSSLYSANLYCESLGVRLGRL